MRSAKSEATGDHLVDDRFLLADVGFKHFFEHRQIALVAAHAEHRQVEPAAAWIDLGALNPLNEFIVLHSMAELFEHHVRCAGKFVVRILSEERVGVFQVILEKGEPLRPGRSNRRELAYIFGRRRRERQRRHPFQRVTPDASDHEQLVFFRRAEVDDLNLLAGRDAILAANRVDHLKRRSARVRIGRDRAVGVARLHIERRRFFHELGDNHGIRGRDFLRERPRFDRAKRAALGRRDAVEHQRRDEHASANTGQRQLEC